MENTATTTPVLAFTNHGGKFHTHTKCGVTSRSLLWNFPTVQAEVSEAETCKRCSGRGFMEATDENIAKAAFAAGRQSHRLGAPEYVAKVTASLTARRDDLTAKADIDVVEYAAALLLGVEVA